VSHGFIATEENEEDAQQLSQDGDVELCGLIIAIVFIVICDLGEEGRRDKGLSGGRASP